MTARAEPDPDPEPVAAPPSAALANAVAVKCVCVCANTWQALYGQQQAAGSTQVDLVFTLKIVIDVY